MIEGLTIEACDLAYEQIVPLLKRVDAEFDPPFFEHLNVEDYARKLEQSAHFIIVSKDNELVGVLVYYKNNEEKCLYIPMIVCISRFTRLGLSHRMLMKLQEDNKDFNSIRLQVLKSNEHAISFYKKEGFMITEAADCSRLDCIKILHL